MPARELALFEEAIGRAKDLLGLATTLEGTTSRALDVSDINRAAFVQGVSAFDAFIHEEVRVRILAIFATKSTLPAALSRFRVSLESTQNAMAAANLDWLDTEIREQHSLLSFQKPDKVADAFRLITDVQLWREAAAHLGYPASGGDPGDKIMKRRLTLIVDRRNIIVHQSDRDPTPPGDTRYPMDRATAADALSFLESTGKALQAVSK